MSEEKLPNNIFHNKFMQKDCRKNSPAHFHPTEAIAASVSSQRPAKKPAVTTSIRAIDLAHTFAAIGCAADNFRL